MLDIGFTSLETEDTVVIILSKSYVRSGDFQVYKEGFLRSEGEYGISPSLRNPAQAILNAASMLKSPSVIGSLDVVRSSISLVIGNRSFFNFWKETSSALQNSCQPEVFKNSNRPMMINIV